MYQFNPRREITIKNRGFMRRVTESANQPNKENNRMARLPKQRTKHKYNSAPITLREGHAAVNVKVHLPYLELPQEALDRAWDMGVEGFWMEAGILAHKRGYAQVFAEGQSNGWCVPFYQTASDGRRQFKQWPGQGPDNGYPRYPDVTLPGEREKFRAFERDILKLLAESKTHYAVMAREYALEVQSNG
jgi:hypothetical protein